jgi:hypothetical protein
VAALIVIIMIDIVVVGAVLYYGLKDDEHSVSVTAPSIQALNSVIEANMPAVTRVETASEQESGTNEDE